jgi:hypothetical protein
MSAERLEPSRRRTRLAKAQALRRITDILATKCLN